MHRAIRRARKREENGFLIAAIKRKEVLIVKKKYIVPRIVGSASVHPC